MRQLALVTCLAVLLALPAMADGLAEVEVAIPSQGFDMPGTLELPDGGPAPVVLLLHGFTSTRDELATPATPEGVFAHVADLLGEAGFASLRVEFVHSVAGPGGFAGMTFENQVADGLAALEFLRGDARVRGDAIFLVGWSQGGLVATAVAGRSQVPVATALWAAPAEPLPTFAGVMGQEAIDAGLVTGDTPLEVTLMWGEQVSLKQGFFEGLQTFDPQVEVAAYPGPLFVAQGSTDPIVPFGAADLLIAAHEGPEELWVRDMDHAFNTQGDDGTPASTDTLDAMVTATVAFFRAHGE
jgi:hypothetical protein